MPSNPYFDFRASAYRFAPLTLARAAAVNARLDEVTDGFDAVKTAVDLKAPSASPTFTGDATFNTATVAFTAGTVTVPSPGAITDDSTKVPTTAWVHDLVGSLSVGLPVQTGNTGKFLGTDGVTASWVRQVGLGRSGVQLVSADAALTAGATVAITVSTSGLLVTLPDATTLPLGEHLLMLWGSNTASKQGVLGFDGELLDASRASTYDAVYILTDNSTQRGTWRRWVPSDGVHADMPATTTVIGPTTTAVASSSFARTLSLGGGTFLQACHASGSIRAYIVTVTGFAASVGTEASAAEAGTLVWAKLLQVTGGYVYAYATATEVRAVAITVSGSTVSIGATGLLMSGSGIGVDEVDAAASGASAVAAALLSSTEIRACACSITGTTLNVGSPQTAITDTSFSTETVRIAAYAAGSFVLAAHVNKSSAHTLRACHLGVASLVVTAGAVASEAATGSLEIGIVPVSSTSVLIGAAYSTDPGTARVASVSGTTLTLHTKLTLTSGISTAQAVTLVACGSYFALCIGNGSSGYVFSLSVSGTTVTQNTSTTATAGKGLTYDGTWLVAQDVSMSLLSVGSSGVSSVLSATTTGFSAGTGTVALTTERVTGLKAYTVFNQSDAKVAVVRYGGVA